MTGTPRTARAIGLALLLSVVSLGVRADEGPPFRRIGIEPRQDRLSVSFRYRDVFRPKVRSKLKSGLPTTIVMRLSVREAETDTPVATYGRTCQIVFDLWEEKFRVDVQDPIGKIYLEAEEEQEAVDRCAILEHVPVAIGLARGKSYVVQVTAEANPLSPDLLRNIKRWLSRPQGSAYSASPGENFFGSFLSIFVNQRLGAAEAAIEFRSQPFTLN